MKVLIMSGGLTLPEVTEEELAQIREAAGDAEVIPLIAPTFDATCHPELRHLSHPSAGCRPDRSARERMQRWARGWLGYADALSRQPRFLGA